MAERVRELHVEAPPTEVCKILVVSSSMNLGRGEKRICTVTAFLAGLDNRHGFHAFRCPLLVADRFGLVRTSWLPHSVHAGILRGSTFYMIRFQEALCFLEVCRIFLWENKPLLWTPISLHRQ